MRNKGLSIASFIADSHIDHLLITETWIRENDTKAFIADLTPPGLAFHSQPRSRTVMRGGKLTAMPGGGVGCFTDAGGDGMVLSGPKFNSFEYISVANTIHKHKLIFVTIYCSPGYPSQFFEEFQEFLSHLSSMKQDFIIGGDFNLHIGSDAQHTSSLNDILDMFGLRNHINFPTHINGNILDLFITPKDFNKVKSIVPAEPISDHSSIIVSLDFSKPPVQKTSPIHHTTGLSLTNLWMTSDHQT